MPSPVVFTSMNRSASSASSYDSMSKPTPSPHVRATHSTFAAKSSCPWKSEGRFSTSTANFSPSWPRRRLAASRRATSILLPFLDSQGFSSAFGTMILSGLDDRSHAMPVRRERDLLLDRACRTAGLPLLRVPASVGYDRGSIRTLISTWIRGAFGEAGGMRPDGCSDNTPG